MPAREDELAQVDVPIPSTRPADAARAPLISGPDDRVDMSVSEVPDAREATRTTGRCEEDGPALDRIDLVGSPRRRSAFRAVVAHRDIDPVVIDRAALRIGSVEERSADRMLAPVRSHGPAAPGVVVDLRDVQLPRYRHPSGLWQPPTVGRCVANRRPGYASTYVVNEVLRKGRDSDMTRALLCTRSDLGRRGLGRGRTEPVSESHRASGRFQPEGIAITGEQFYVGSIPTGRVRREPSNGPGCRARHGACRSGGDRIEGRSRQALRGGRFDRRRVRLQREDGQDHRRLRASDERGDVRQRRRRHEARGMVHGLAEAVLYRLPLGPNGRQVRPTPCRR